MTDRVTSDDITFVFFGTGEIAVGVLDELEKARLLPSLIVTTPDKPRGRNLIPTPPPIKSWALSRGLKVAQPEKLDPDFCHDLQATGRQLFVVVDFGKMLSKKLLDLPMRGTLNMHPSLLPRLRGPSPIRSAILTDEKNTGVSIMLVNEKWDEGPLIAQRPIAVQNWPPRGRDLDTLLSHAGGRLLAEILPHWVSGELEAHVQNHDVATYSAMIQKEDGLLDLVHGDPYQNLLKIRAFDGWPGTYVFFERSGKKIRVQILDAHLEGSKLVIDMVKAEGKKEMSYVDFVRSGAIPLS